MARCEHIQGAHMLREKKKESHVAFDVFNNAHLQ